MRNLLIIFFLIPALLNGEGLLAPEAPLIESMDPIYGKETESLDQLIQTNENRLIKQKKLKELMVLLEKQKDAFFYGNQTKKHATNMVHTARQILEIIKKEHLGYLFSSDYLEELTLFASIAGKSSPSRP